MNLKRFIAAMSACAAVSAAAMSVNVNAVELSAYAYLCGDMGTAEVKSFQIFLPVLKLLLSTVTDSMRLYGK